MNEIKKRDELFTVFTVVKRGKTTMMIRNGYKEQLLGMGIENPHRFAEEPGGRITSYAGRGEMISAPIKGSQNERMVIKHYFHGGFFGRITKDVFWGVSRPQKEMIASEQMHSLGLPTSEVLVAHRHHIFGPFYRGDLVSKEIPDSIDLIAYLGRFKRKPSREELKEKREVVIKVASVISRMHEKGIYHGDLHLKNILIQKVGKGDIRVYILDLDKTKVKKEVGLGRRMRNLARFNRSGEKLRAKGGWITKSDKLRFFKEYCRGDKRISLNTKIYIRKCSTSLVFHRLGWRFSERTGGKLTNLTSTNKRLKQR